VINWPSEVYPFTVLVNCNVIFAQYVCFLRVITTNKNYKTIFKNCILFRKLTLHNMPIVSKMPRMHHMIIYFLFGAFWARLGKTWDWRLKVSSKLT